MSEFEKFEIGSISLFTGLAFLTLLPVIMKSLFLVVDPNVYRLFGGLFLVISSFFYSYSYSYLATKILYIGIAFIIFSLFQIAFASTNSGIFLFTNIASLILGAFFCILSLYLKKKNYN